MRLALFSLTVLVVITVIVIKGNADQAHIGRNRDSITVEIEGQGVVLGNYATTLWSNQTIFQFRGIPYAESPSGSLRFKPPVAKLPWRHILDATNYGKRCPVITTISQLSPADLNADLEDCLNLCVYTKDITANLPVMFYIYGGGFYNGSSLDHPPRHLLESNIVLVVPQYRIGALGWLSTRSKEMPGNVPVLDLTMALEWVQKNIRYFGGNPTRVTIFGQSAGAVMSSALLLSPKTPLHAFKGAIIQSGSILAKWAINSEPKQQVERVAQVVGCADANRTNQELLKCLQQVDVFTMLKATETESFAPIVGDFNGILPDAPAQLFKNYNKTMPIMTGFTKDDGSFVLATYYDEMKKTIGNLSSINVRQFANGLMDMSGDTTLLSHNLLTRLLFTPELLSGNNHKSALPSYFDLINDVAIKSPVIAFSSNILHNRLANVFFYTFDYEGENTRFGYEFGNAHYPFNGGVHHSNDNIYLFSTHALNEPDTNLAIKMVELWTSFAIYGVPQTADGPVILPMENENGPYFHINSAITIGNNILDEITSALDDPENQKLDRKDIEF